MTSRTTILRVRQHVPGSRASPLPRYGRRSVLAQPNFSKRCFIPKNGRSLNGIKFLSIRRARSPLSPHGDHLTAEGPRTIEVHANNSERFPNLVGTFADKFATFRLAAGNGRSCGSVEVIPPRLCVRPSERSWRVFKERSEPLELSRTRPTKRVS